MYRHPRVFPIVELIGVAGLYILPNPAKDLQFYITHTLETRIGLQFQVWEIVNGVNKLWPIVPQEISEKAIIQNVLLRYSQRFPLKDDLDLWKKLLEEERLN